MRFFGIRIGPKYYPLALKTVELWLRKSHREVMGSKGEGNFTNYVFAFRKYKFDHKIRNSAP